MQKFIKKIGAVGILLFQLVPITIIVFSIYSFEKSSGSPGWIYQPGTDCKLYTHDHATARSFHWDGACENGYVQGEGTLTVLWNNTAYYTYKGSVENGKFSGFGKWIMASDGDTYEGEFKNGLPHGNGSYYNDDGDHYVGEYKEGMRSGMGTYWYEPNSPIFKYEGEWKENKKEGFGALYYRDGTIEKGIFADDVLKNMASSQTENEPLKKKNILITNDDGIEDMDRLICLAEALSPHANKIVISVSSENRSGTSNMMATFKKGQVQVKQLSHDVSDNIEIYEVDGYPADCVLFGALGVFYGKGESIDLVISGINGGANEGAAWFGSGTVGAARTAALMKIPTLAVSGIDEDGPNAENRDKICSWVAQLATSSLVSEMNTFEYLTISIPDDLESIKGVKVVERAITFDRPPFLLEAEADVSEKGALQTWRLRPNDPTKAYDMPADNDVFYYYQDYIVIVPMSINENNPQRLTHFKQLESKNSPF
ncbi:5'/3'-nucleotidase SurE [Aureisphaera galaxeae]|uniref:5'/3'-nucleotidase SurE n=1 Tax=Aureisphaera galaxeae TaxID=1538023 RepID=UPI00235089BA|nr:5'/3'-nucleotidase SurE [Aureisphaera galaxeae]MDC8002486.1 5'/3'-nucleotidase SurE [Aureisphaera galaxeae]